MDIPKYTEEVYWNDVIQQYIDGEPSIRMRHDIEYHVWEYFKDCLRRKNRFFFNHPLIPLLKAALEEHVYELKAGTEVFRARNDDKRELWKEWDTYASAQHTPKVIAGLKSRGVAEDAIEKATQHYEKLIASEKFQEAKARIEAGFQGYDAKGSTAPPSSKAAEGRCNPKGVPYLYVALEKHTAIAEIRPFFQDTISLALLKPVRDLKLVDFFFEPSDTVMGTEILFNNIQRDFSRIHKSNDGEYLITQFIAALIEYLGYDGLRFRSSLVKEGTNYVIFNKSTCEVESSELCFLSEVVYTFGRCK